MSVDRRALIRKRLASTGLREQTRTSGVPHRTDLERAPLSHSQLHVWRYEAANPKSISNNLGLLLTFTGKVDLQTLVMAFDRVVDRHEILRTTYHTGPDGAPFQRIHDSLPFSRAIQQAEADEAEAYAQLALREPFDLTADPPLRLQIFRTGKDRIQAAIVFHHIVWDGATFDVLCRDLEVAYAQPAVSLPTLPYQFGDIAAWQHDRQDRIVARELGYWTNRLKGPRPRHRLTTAGANVAANKEAAGRVDHRLTSSAALTRLAAAHKVTPFVAFTACWAAVLGVDAAADVPVSEIPVAEIAVGTTVLNRDQPGSEKLVGNLANHVVLRIPMDAHPRSHALIAATAAEVDGAFSHRDLPYEVLLDSLGGQELDAPPTLFDTLVVFIPGGIEGPRLAGAGSHWRRLHNGATQFPLVPLGLEVFVRGRGDHRVVDIEATHARSAFDAETVTRLLARLDKTIHDADQEAW